MAVITTRQTTGTGATVKNSPLSNQEIDQNFINLNTEIDPVLSYPSIAPSLNLDFANSKTLDPRITFTRSSSATYYDGKTVMKAEENLITWSNTFSNAVWVGATAASIVSTTILAPDGTNTALELAYTGQNGGLSHSGINIENGKTYTISFWSRRDSGTNVLHLVTNNGVLINNYSPTTTWTRYSFTYTHATTASTVRFIQDRNSSGFTNVQLWGCQVEERSFLTAYTPTTTASITNYIPQLLTAAAGVPRFDCNPTTGESLGLLVEEQRTNIQPYSSDFSNATYVKTGCSINTTAIIAPDGTLTGNKIIEDTSTGGHSFYTGGRAITAGTSFALTVFAKAGERTSFSMSAGAAGDSSGGIFNLTLGTATTSNTGASTGTATIQSVGNGWYRCIVVGVCPSSSSIFPSAGLLSGGSGSYTGNGFNGLYIWGMQVEAGAFPTSYIPTVASTVTRSADSASMTGTAFSSWYNQNEGTLYVEAAKTSAAQTNFVAGFGYSSTNYIGLLYNTGGLNTIIQPWIGAFGTTSFSSGVTTKAAVGYKVNDYASVINGTLSTNTSPGPIPSGTSGTLYLGSAPFSPSTITVCTIRRIAYYPLRLTNTQLQAITG